MLIDSWFFNVGHICPSYSLCHFVIIISRVDFLMLDFQRVGTIIKLIVFIVLIRFSNSNNPRKLLWQSAMGNAEIRSKFLAKLATETKTK